MKKNIYLCNQNKNTMTTVDISTKFLGIDIPSPIISGSCGLTSKVENLLEMEKNGAGAVILKSLFEEQITFDIQKSTGFLSNFEYSESYDYISNHVEGFEIDKYSLEQNKDADALMLLVMSNYEEDEDEEEDDEDLEELLI